MQNDVFDREDNKYVYCGRAGWHIFSICVALGEGELDAINVSMEIWPKPKFRKRIKEAWSILRGHHTVFTFNISRPIAKKIEKEMMEKLKC